MFTFNKFTYSKGALKKRSIIALILVTAIISTSLLGLAIFTDAAYITDGETTQFVFSSSDDAMQILADSGYTIGEYDQISVTNTLSNILNIKILRAEPVTLNENGKETEYMTVKATVGEFLGSIGIELNEFDEVDFELNDEIKSQMTITIKYAPTLTIKADGKTSTVTVAYGTTVQEALDKAGIKLENNDKVEPVLGHHLRGDEEATVKRVTYKEEKATEEIPYSTTMVNSSSLAAGSKTVTKAGVKGSKEVTKKVKYEDGVKVSEEVISEKVITEAVNEVVTVGTASRTAAVNSSTGSVATVASPTSFYSGQVVSPAPADVELDANGIPVHYSKIMTGKTSAYTSPVGGVVSCGQTARIGLVAVNPNIIPYGTRMYIVANDGTVYGYAIAADTGGALMRGKVLIDLYMGANNEAVCYQWGIRNATIYILD